MPRKPAVRPVRWTPPPASSPKPITARPVQVFPLTASGPEDVLLDGQGRVLTGVVDGRILRIELASDPVHPTVETIADTGGRPLGLEWLPDGRLLVCDAHRGLLAVDVGDGRTETLVGEVDGTAMRFCNNAAVAPDGTVYFTDSSRRFGIQYYKADLLEHSNTGRLLRRDPSGAVEVVLDGLQFPNGVALAPTGDWLAIAETAGYRLLRLWLSGARAGQHEVLTDELPGFPDNLCTGSDGLIWIALPSRRNPLLDRLLPRAPILRRALWALPASMHPAESRSLHVRAVAADGTVVHDLHCSGQDYHMVTGLREHEGLLYLGSLAEQAIARLKVA